MPNLRLAWIQSADDPTLGGDVAAYQVARGIGPNPTAIIHTIPASAAADDTRWSDFVQPGTYFYRVRAVDGAGNTSLWSDEASITVGPTDGLPLASEVTLSDRAFYSIEIAIRPAYKVTIGSSAAYRVNLADRRLHTVTLSDHPAYVVALADRAAIS